MRSLICLILLTCLPATSWAALGDHESSVQQDGVALKAMGRRVLKTNAAFTTHEMTTPTATVKEYINGDGVVFAASWQGIKAPDLSVLMGSYYTDYQTAKRSMAQRYGHGPVIVKGSRAVVLRHGHMRDLRGLAYVPSLMPPGVRVEDLQ